MSFPLTSKPLSEDEGTWYYLAVFWKRGVRLYKNFFFTYGYFGIPIIAGAIYNYLGNKKLKSLQYFKTVWYCLTVISIYWLTYCFLHNFTLSFIAALIFAIIIAIPNTLFALTYGEHFFILPINLSIIFTYYGFATGNFWYFMLSGLMSAWAVQMKSPALLFGILLPATFVFATDIYMSLGSYLIAFIGFNLLPLVILKKYGKIKYLLLTFAPVISLLINILGKLKLEFLVKHVPESLRLYDPYIKNHLNKSLQIQWLSFKKFMLPAIKDLYLILILAAVQVPYLFIKFDYFTFSIFLLLIVFVLMQQAQKNYYTPHINPCWAPVSILAAKTIWDMWPYLLNSGVLGWTMIVFLGIESIKIGDIIVKSFSKSQRNIFGYLGPMLGMLFRLPESIGQYIQQNSEESEKLFVWGDQPSIYLYAKREAFNTDYLILYAHQGQILKEKEILDSMREKPPELLLFYNYKVNDGWNINRLQDTIGIPYNFLKSFKITDNQGRTIKDQRGIIYEFPLYRRDDDKYKEILLDRAMIAKKIGGAGSAQKYLEDILEVLPKSFEASIRLSMMRHNTCDVNSARRYLENKLAENHNAVEAAILLRLLAEIEVSAGNTDGALKNYEKSHNSNPSDFRIHNGLGGLYYSMGKLEEAFKSFQKALELHPYSSDVLNNIGVILSQAGKREDATKCFQRALSLMPSNPDAIKNYESIKSLSKATK
ncbi:MAG: tetratricopeptide repeat protein [Candidatus Scalinduaceae bacterium]